MDPTWDNCPLPTTSSTDEDTAKEGDEIEGQIRPLFLHHHAAPFRRPVPVNITFDYNLKPDRFHQRAALRIFH
ncbi:unnamed protein product [Linum trigynum]|uniref:Uncharacterized protein n=1 Tax=Linum trigynum TaxID=586398 RepID=A0AAV2DZ16_9ROSI